MCAENVFEQMNFKEKLEQDFLKSLDEKRRERNYLKRMNVEGDTTSHQAIKKFVT